MATRFVTMIAAGVAGLLLLAGCGAGACDAKTAELVEAIEADDREAVHAALDAGADPDVECVGITESWDETTLSPTWVAATFGHNEALDVLLERGADPNATLSDAETTYTLLAWAARGGNLEGFRRLLEAGADPTAIAMDDGEIQQTILSFTAAYPTGDESLWPARAGGDPVEATRLALDAGAEPVSPTGELTGDPIFTLFSLYTVSGFAQPMLGRQLDYEETKRLTELMMDAGAQPDVEGMEGLIRHAFKGGKQLEIKRILMDAE